jgi:small subunit ribosomal protein S9
MIKAATTKTAKPSTPKPVKEKTASVKSARTPVAHGIGRRKKSIARVWLRPGGKGNLFVNGKNYDEYFSTEITRLVVQKPGMIMPAAVQRYDIEVNVVGGGLSGQADAVKLGIARALLEAYPDARAALREQGLLTVDARVKERKKYGQKAARRKFQFVKR